MKKNKRLTAAVVVLLLSSLLLFTGCMDAVVSIAEFVVAVNDAALEDSSGEEQQERGTTSDVTEQIEMPGREEEQQTETEEPMPEVEEEPTPEPEPAPIIVNTRIKETLQDGNSVVKKYFEVDEYDAEAEIFMGGIPRMYYSLPDTVLTYFQFVDTEGNVGEIWGNVTSHNERGLPDYNPFPDSYPVDYVYHASHSMFVDIFLNAPEELGSTRSMAALQQYLGTDVAAVLVPGEDLGGYTTYDKHTYTVSVDGVTLIFECYDDIDTVGGVVMYLEGKEPVYMI